MARFTKDSIVPTLRRVIGNEATQLLRQAGAYGGTTMEIPRRELGKGEATYAAIVDVIGETATQRLCRHFGGERFYLPKQDKSAQLLERNQKIVRAYNAGDRIAELVFKFDLSDRQIRNVLKGTDMSISPNDADEFNE